MTARHGLEHRLWKFLKSENLAGGRFVLACSGGADSVALLRAFAAVQPAGNLTVAYVHHGPSDDGYRDTAAAFVETLAKGLGLSFETRRHDGEALRSEQDLRRFRRRALEEIRVARRADFLVTGHHRGDLLETRLIRLLRGTGPEGLPAIRPRRGVWLRPFLETPGGELRSYLDLLSQNFVVDPSNEDVRFLRNWIRRVWLPSLETRSPGAVDSLGRSLENIASSLRTEVPRETPVLERPQWMGADPAEKLRLAASLLRAAGQSEMTRGQLEEIRKRLDSPEKVIIFTGAGCEWDVNAQRILARKRGSKS